MPTGYTAALEESGYNVKKWLKENAIRAMGVCVMLRDHGTMTETQILESLEKDAGDSYYTDKLREAKKALHDTEARTEGDWCDCWRSARELARQENEKRLTEFNSKKEKHTQSMNEVNQLLATAVKSEAGEVTIGTLRFAKEQLESAFEFDYGSGPYLDENESISLDNYKAKCRKKVEWDVNYHTDKSTKETERTLDRSAEYARFVKFVDSAKA